MSAPKATSAPTSRAPATYARQKTFDVGSHDNSDASVSSPAQHNLFDSSSSPLMRSPNSHARNEAAYDTSFTTVGDEGSQQSPLAAKSRSRVVTGSDDEDDDQDDVSTASPRKFTEDEEEDEDQLADQHDGDDDDVDDDDAIARMRKKLGLRDPESSELSSAPPTTDAEPTSSSLPAVAGRRIAPVRSSSEDIEEDDEDDDGFGRVGSTSRSRPALKGFASRMKARSGAKSGHVRDDDDDEEGNERGEPSTSVKRLRRITTSDVSEAEDSSDDRLPSPPETTHEIKGVAREAQSAAQRAERLRQMAARRRAEMAMSEDDIESDGDVDKDPIDDDGEIMTILTSFQKVDAAKRDPVPAGSGREDATIKKKKKRPRGDHDGASKAPKVKSLSKAELEEMDRINAKITREKAIKRARAVFQKPHERQTFGITNLLASVTAAEASRAKPSVQAAPSSDTPAVSDPIDDVISGDEAPEASPSPRKSPVPKPRLTFLPPPLDVKSGPLAAAGPSTSRPAGGHTDSIRDDDDDDDLQLPDAGQAAQKALERREMAAKQAKLRQMKLKALEADTKRRAEAAAAQQAKRTAAQVLMEESADDELEFQRPELLQPQKLFGTRVSSAKPPSIVQPAQPVAAKPQSPVARRVKAPPVTMDALRGSLLSKVKAQNLNMRKSSGQTRKTAAVEVEESQDPTALLQRLQNKAQNQRIYAEKAAEQEEDADDGEYVDGQSPAASGDEGEVAEDDVLALGSGSEGEDDQGSEEEQDDVEDSDKENSQPQLATLRRAAAEEEEEEEETSLTLARPGRRRAAVAALSDDDEEVEEQTGGSQSQQRSPLRAIHQESSSADEFGKPITGADEGSPGWSQFFQSTARQPGAALRMVSEGTSDGQDEPAAASAGTKQRTEDALGAFFEPTQQEGSSADLQGAPRATDTQSRNEDALGAFFEPTQQSPMVEATARPTLLGPAVESAGFSQFFEDATQPGGAITTIRSNTAGSMPPPSAFGSRSTAAADKAPSYDAFEAIRRAQDQEAALPPMPTMLPSLTYDADADLDLEGDSGPARSSSSRLTTPVKAPLPYLNRQGFYTQTRPSFSDALLDSQTQSQSQSQTWGRYAGDAAAAEDGEEAQRSDRGSQSLESPPRKRKHLRRASSPIQSDKEEEEEDASDDNEDVQDDDEEQEGANDDSIVGSAIEDQRGSRTPSPAVDEHEAAPRSAQPRNAFDVLQHSAANAQSKQLGGASKKRTKSHFVEGEAEESEDEDAGIAKRKSRGGLGGIYSDSEGSAGEDEEDDEEDDGRDLEGLVDDEREADEADKNVLARERFNQDMDALDAQTEAIHQKAIAGKMRDRKRGRGGAEAGDVGGYLDDDFEEADLERRAMNPRAGLPQKRRLEGGDGMDALAANAASEAFVRGYAETHQNVEDPEAYSFLGGADDDDDAEEDEDEDADEGGGEGTSRGVDDGKERVTAEQLRRELRERRRAKKMRLVDDDDDDGDDDELEKARRDAEEERQGMDEDDDEGMMGVGPHFVDRVQQARKDKEPKDRMGHAAPKRANTTYGRATLDVVTNGAGDVDDLEDEEEDAADALDHLVMRADRAKRAINEAERQRLAKIAADFGAGDSRGSMVHARKRGGAGASITSFKPTMSNSSSSSSLGMGGPSYFNRAKSGSATSMGAAGRKRIVGNSASEGRLVGLSSVMARQSQFSETQ